MERARWTIAIFAAGLLAVLAGMSWVTWHALRLERREVAARADAAFQERVRLALWRMDSALTPVLAREAARPYFHYQAFYPADRAYTRMYKQVSKGDVLVPSPLLRASEDFVKLYFQQADSGELNSPQAPPPEQRGLAEGLYASAYAMRTTDQRLAELAGLLSAADRSAGRVKMKSESGGTGALGLLYERAGRAVDAGAANRPEIAAVQQFSDATQTPLESQQYRNTTEFRNRAQVATYAQNSPPLRSGEAPAPKPGGSPTPSADAPGATRVAAGRESDDRAEAGDKDAETAKPNELDEKTRAELLARKAATPEPGPAAPTSAAPNSPAPSTSPPPVTAPPSGTSPGATPADGQPDLATLAKQIQAKKNIESDKDARPRGVTGQATGQETGQAAGKASTGVMLDNIRFGSVASDDAAPKLRQDALTVSPDEPPVVQGPFEARWLGSEAEPQLVMLRDVRIGGTRVRQGYWLDWPALREWLLLQATDLGTTAGAQSTARLVPLLSGVAALPPGVLGRTLAAIPVELDAATPPLPPLAGWSPIRTTLAVTWVGVILAGGAIGWVLRASLDLAERRGRFVSAVTHELRTPLTTFCLYSQMLADGMVPDEDARASYVRTLKQESTRLAGIVESVLDYARLGRRKRTPRQDVPVGDLIARVEPGLARRCEQAGAAWSLDVSGDRDRLCPTDPATVERVLQNLVDNACKYAGRNRDPDGTRPNATVALSVSIGPGAQARFELRDNGPGVAKADRARIFRPFVRGTAQGDGAIPGLGLGLALSRGLARELGGELSIADADGPGATFVLVLPLVS